jgi:hypothetical protein
MRYINQTQHKPSARAKKTLIYKAPHVWGLAPECISIEIIIGEKQCSLGCNPKGLHDIYRDSFTFTFYPGIDLNIFFARNALPRERKEDLNTDSGHGTENRTSRLQTRIINVTHSTIT